MRLISFLSFLIVPLFVHAQQGSVVFANNPSTPITLFGDNTHATVALYGSVLTGLGDDSSLVPLGSPVNTLVPGLFVGGARNIGIPGAVVTLQIRAWTGGFASWDLAFAAATSNPGINLNKTIIWEQSVGGGMLPAEPITGPGRFQGLELFIIPEPSSAALALIGGLVFLFSFRHRFARR
jgi:hypothetical protein